jgi:hypothetical protein
MNKTRLLFFSLTFGILGGPLLEARAASVPSVNPPLALGAKNSSTPDSSSKEVPFYMTYNYYGEKYRDPFVPLIGEARSDQTTDRPPAIASLILKGIVQDSNGRMALITGGVSSYILRGGRLYNDRNHVVKGLSGVIKTDSVVIIGSDRTIREIRAKTAL